MQSNETTDGHRPVSSHRLKRLAAKTGDEQYRHSYVATHTRQFLARQMHAFRGDKTQSEFGKLLGKPQSVVSRLEDPGYGKWTLQTLFEVARKLDVAVEVRFVDFPTFFKTSGDMSDDAVCPSAYDQQAIDRLAADAETPSSGSAAGFLKLVEQANAQVTSMEKWADRPEDVPMIATKQDNNPLRVESKRQQS